LFWIDLKGKHSGHDSEDEEGAGTSVLWVPHFPMVERFGWPVMKKNLDDYNGARSLVIGETLIPMPESSVSLLVR